MKKAFVAIAVIFFCSGVIRAETGEDPTLNGQLTVEGSVVRESEAVAYLEVSISNDGQTPIELSGHDVGDLSQKLQITRVDAIGVEPISKMLRKREILSTEEMPSSFTLKAGASIRFRRDIASKAVCDPAEPSGCFLLWELPIELCKYPEIEVFKSSLAGKELLKQERSRLFARGCFDLQR